MMGHRRIIHIICGDDILARKYRRELECGCQQYDFRLSQSPEAALRDFPTDEINVILFDESAKAEALEPAVEELATVAPVVAVTAAQREPELKLLLASGTVDFVPRAGDFPQRAAQAVKRRAQSLDGFGDGDLSTTELSRDFGEILRHEVNNPLTGILGNAELLLERRDRLPPAAIERVETIADLAVRLRETVRRLSHAWDTRPAGPL